MKKFFAIVVAIATMAVNTSTVFAEELDTVAVKEEITAMDYVESDSSEFGKLVEHNTIDNGDGSYIEEFIYVKPADVALCGMESSDSATYTKENKYYVNGYGWVYSAWVSATFSWDTSEKKVTVLDTDGWVEEEDPGANVTLKNEEITVKGNNSRKATVTYSVTRKINSTGFTHSISAKVACDYNGKCS